MLEKIIMVVLIGIIFFVIADIILYIMLKIKQFKNRKQKESCPDTFSKKNNPVQDVDFTDIKK